MEKKDENDSREFTRIPLKVKALIKSGDKVVHSGETHDLSMKGLFFQTNEKLPIGTECDVTLILGDLEACPPKTDPGSMLGFGSKTR